MLYPFLAQVMHYYMNKTTLLLLATILIVNSAPLYAEYIRATNEDEVILISTSSEVKMGKSLAKKTEKRFGLDDDMYL